MSKTPALPREWVEDPPLIITSREEEQEMMSLTPQELTSIGRDLFGVTSSLDSISVVNSSNEDDTFKSELKMLDSELLKIPDEEMHTFITAMKERPELVNDAHRASFLRRDDFDAKRASRRLVSYWERRRELFGSEKVYLPLTLDGAMRDDVDNLSQGFVSALPVKDLNGRGIFFCNSGHLDWSKYSRESMQRTIWYLFELLAADPEVQKKGIIILSYTKQAVFQNFDHKFYRSTFEILDQYLPVRLRAFHLCSPPPFVHILFPVAKHLLGKRLRERLAVHYGSERDCVSSLLKYGLPADRIPTEMGGDLIIDRAAWPAEQLRIERHVLRENRTDNLDAIAETLTLLKKGVGSFNSQNNRKVSDEHDITNNAHNTLQAATCTSVIHNNDAVAHHEATCTSALIGSMTKSQVSVAEVDSERYLARRRRRPASEGDKMTSSPEFGGSDQRKTAVDVFSNEGNHSMNRAFDAVFTYPNLSLSQSFLLGSFKLPNMNKSALFEEQKFDSGKLSLKQTKKQLSGRLTENVTCCPGKRGRQSDPRMDKAVAAKLKNPELSLLDALNIGGFKFPDANKPGMAAAAVLDEENVSLAQRKNQLLRRLRNNRKNKEQAKI